MEHRYEATEPVHGRLGNMMQSLLWCIGQLIAWPSYQRRFLPAQLQLPHLAGELFGKLHLGITDEHLAINDGAYRWYQITAGDINVAGDGPEHIPSLTDPGGIGANLVRRQTA
jgi:hypothetical protein